MNGRCSFIIRSISMNRWYYKIAVLGNRHYETFLHVGILCWVAIFDLLDKQVYSWLHYCGALGVLVVVQLPILLFSCYKPRMKETLPANRYWLYWLACFGLYLWAAFFVCTTLFQVNAHWQRLAPISLLCTLSLELLLTIAAWLRTRMQQWPWMKWLSLDRSLLISLLLIAAILSIMAVSSIGNPKYERPEGLLVGFEFDARKLFAHFGLFLAFTLQFLFMYLCGYFFFYVNNRVLVPHVLKPKGLIVYVLAGLAVVSITYPVMAQLLLSLPVNKRLGNIFAANPFALENAGGAIIILLLSLPVVLALQWSRQNSRIMALEKEKAQAELDLLKQQLNPHFFFNTLNNLYALSLTQSKQTSESILQLSELTRYVLYKTKEPTVTVQEEVKYLEDFMWLQQIRLKRKPDIQFTQEIAPATPRIAPLLLIVLVENAFKHGIEPAENEAFLHIRLHTGASRLHLTCVNSFEERTTVAGIGLSNLQRRLALLYPGKHLLKTAIENHTFKAELELDLT